MDPKVIQKQAEDYVKTHKIDSLLKEMLSTALDEQNTEQPIIGMINYLSHFISDEDLEKAGIKLQKSKEKKFNPIMKDFYFPENSSLIIKRFLTPNIFDKIKGIKTKLGGHVSHIIDTALKLDNKETVGLIATDGECYSKMSQLFKPAVSFLHAFDSNKSLFNYYNTLSIENSHIHSSKFLQLRIKLGRNLANLPYLPYAHDKTRQLICDNIKAALFKLYPKGEFIDINNLEFETIKEIYFDKELNFIAAGLVKDHCGIFIPHTEQINYKNESISALAFLINFNDHLQILKLNTSFDLSQLYTDIYHVNDSLDKELNFDKSEEYGYLTTCPSNVGVGLKISAFLKIPKLINDGNSALLLNKWSLRVKKNMSVESSNEYEVLSKSKQETDIIAFLNSFIIKIVSLVHFEQSLEEEQNFSMKKISDLPSNIKSLYESYYDTYKFVSSENESQMFYFNQLFKSGISSIVGSNLVPTDYKSVHVFRDFINDFVTTETGVYVLKLLESKNFESYESKYNEKTSFNHSNDKQNVSVSFSLGRNFDNLNFFNNEKDVAHLVTHELFNNILESLRKAYPNHEITQKDNSIQINSIVTLHLAMEQNITNTKGNHLLINGNNLEEIYRIEQIISLISKFKYDNAYGYLQRNIVYSGCGLYANISIEKDESNSTKDHKALADKYDLKLSSIEETRLVFDSMFCLSLSGNEIMKKVNDFLLEY